MTDVDGLGKYLASYRGIDGGNPAAAVWICGIEHGGDSDKDIADLSPELEPGYWTEKFKNDTPKFSTWPYHQWVAKLMVALRRHEQGLQLEVNLDGWREYLRDELYALTGDTFKLNLFPLQSPRVNDHKWRDAYGARLGLTRKSEYLELCRGARFSFLRNLRGRHKPRIIVGTGKTCRDDFVSAFGFHGIIPEVVQLHADGATRENFIYRDDGTTLIVCPFFGGRFGLGRNALIWELAKQIHDELVFPSSS